MIMRMTALFLWLSHQMYIQWVTFSRVLSNSDEKYYFGSLMLRDWWRKETAVHRDLTEQEDHDYVYCHCFNVN